MLYNFRSIENLPIVYYSILSKIPAFQPWGLFDFIYAFSNNFCYLSQHICMRTINLSLISTGVKMFNKMLKIFERVP